ncbi:MAG: protein arginine kinase [Thermoanaerobacteraceae bacterium]|jgi:protein arginine kinase|uniref:Protein-arginine kinase n=1 Tax=Biomaibacter acetigenes TaxID=2316383 RepID=A0A3G2R8W9_9FIRM|nr:protein arginine kinase [Biomaibacter acetigenes]MDK2878187.1 protein arginine kinase [Thermoanaerobacteraceae bacterium]RKL63726.1 protein arginine kinase [Thermoanaerobacteraceae bacterium SP2]AYO31920.1 protein arginine kinase [Biomaibacter acetigenes]MDN5300851.1 protein arginine kinase [Thermoanaerobacteraceae bacterium]MDN5311676.1 protein arginine kinase [Thermoanaerobacteraceae bacterium]
MGINELMDPSRINWINSPGPDCDIVISSRVRLARNLKDVPFPHLLSESRAREIINEVYDAFRANPVLSRNAELYILDNLSQEQRKMMVEMHLISPDLSASKKGAAIINQDKTLSIMINEEDHLRIQTVFPGLDPEKAYDLASKVDDVLEEKLDFAFDEKIGYLTACPTNVGTGIRASVMMHLPVLTMMNQIGQIFSTITQLGLVVRGLYGEGTQANGNLYQISNQITLGKSEEDIIQNLIGVARQIITSERKARQNLSGEARIRVEDKILRSYGLLTHARLISSEEALAYISDVRLGVDMGIIKNIKPGDVNQLFIITGPAYIQEVSGKTLSPMERDLSRAEFIKQKMMK